MQHTVHIRTNGNLSLYVAKFTNNEMSYFNIFSNNHVRTPIITKEHVSSQKIQWGWASAIWQLDSLFDTVHIVCGAGSIKRSGVRTSICPSVSLSHQSNAVAACSGFAAERRAADPGCGAAAAGRPALSIDIFCAYGAQQQTRRTQLLRLTDGTDWLSDRHRTVL